MRELKFRIWDKQNKTFVKDPTRYQRLAISCDGRGVYSGKYDDCVKDRYIIRQCTGLQDKNGKDIYEGDIVEYNPDEPIFRIGIIEYSDYYNGWSIKDKNCYPSSEYGQYSLASPFLSFNTVKIIGNIFETPELLK